MSKVLKGIATSIGLYVFAKRIKIRMHEFVNSSDIEQNRRDEAIFYSDLISKGQLCFDVGANAGDKSDIFLSLGARVVAFEPQSKCVRKLRNRFRGNGNFIVLEKGLSDKPGILELSVCETSDTISTMSKKWKDESRFSKNHFWGNSINVEVTTLDEAIREYGQPDYIKIDVEGFEFNVIKGLIKSVRLISFEYIDEFSDDSIRCLEYLATLGPIRINILKGMEKNFVFDKFLNFNDFQLQFGNYLTGTGCGDIFVITDSDQDVKKN